MKEFSRIVELKSAYKNGEITPATLFAEIRRKAAESSADNIWIYLLTETEQAPYLDALDIADIDRLPLWGVPFAIKDNIDLAEIATTAGCPDFAYVAKEHAFVVAKLIAAGAIPVGKTNLDQFATGLNGTRSPYGICHHAYFREYISGGSSAGSAVSVAKGLAMFSLGTDTAGSGRVPAAFHGLIGVKPSRGLLSTSGLVPACRSLDCISIMAKTLEDANTVLGVAEGLDPKDAYSRKNPYHNHHSHFGHREDELTIGIPEEDALRFFGDHGYEKAYRKWIAKLEAMEKVTLRTVSYAPFDEAAKLLYEGPWVSERYLACQALIEERPQTIHPVVREIIARGESPLARDLFKSQYRLQALKQSCDATLAELDALMLPTAGRMFTIEEMLANPVGHNDKLGRYTNFVNLLDYSALAIPAGKTTDGRPFGITLVGPVFYDRGLLAIANTLCANTGGKILTDPRYVEVAVAGAHLTGMPLNWQLQACAAKFKEATQTAALYRLYALEGPPQSRPAMVRDAENGRAIAVEIWSLPIENFGAFVASIPAPLGIGKVALSDGRQVSGFICAANTIGEKDRDISRYGGWKAYQDARGAS